MEEDELDEETAVLLIEKAVAEEDLDLLWSLVDSAVDQAGGALAHMVPKPTDVATPKWLIKTIMSIRWPCSLRSRTYPGTRHFDST